MAARGFTGHCSGEYPRLEQKQAIICKLILDSMEGKEIATLLSEDSSQLDTSNLQVFLMGIALVGLNLLLMIFVGLYWTNPEVHQFITGRPL